MIKTKPRPKTRKSPSTVRELAEDLVRLRARVEDLEDARELDASIRRNADKPLIPWEEAKRDIGVA